MAKFANIAEMGTSAGQYRYSVKLIAKLWKPVHIAKMGPSATQYLVKTIEQMCKLANIAKIGLSEDRQRYLMKII